jgi:hypothetical protein
VLNRDVLPVALSDCGPNEVEGVQLPAAIMALSVHARAIAHNKAGAYKPSLRFRRFAA